MFFVQINHTGKGFLFLIFREIKLRKYSSLHKLFYGLHENAQVDQALIKFLWNKYIYCKRIKQVLLLQHNIIQ